MAANVGHGVLAKFAKKLAGNEKKYRDRAVKKLRKYLEAKSSSQNGFSHDDMLVIWKGLHYCMWMSDKLLIQEELAETIASLMHNLKTLPQMLLFIETCLETECREWFLIDRLRLDKFMMMIRRVFRHGLEILRSQKWKKAHIRDLLAVLQKTVHSTTSDTVPDGIKFHVVDLYLDELDTIGVETLSSARVQMFLEPYCLMLTQIKVKTLQEHIVKRIFQEIIFWERKAVETAAQQLAEAEEDAEMGSDEEEMEISLDKHIPVDYKLLADRLFELASSDACLSKNRRRLYNLVKIFRDMSENILPPREIDLALKIRRDLTRAEFNSAVTDMVHFEGKLRKNTSTEMQKRKRKRKLKHQMKMQAQEDDDDDDADNNTPPTKRRKPSREQNGSFSSSDKENGMETDPKSEISVESSPTTGSNKKKRKKKKVPTATLR